jgi:hypothetical protein
MYLFVINVICIVFIVPLKKAECRVIEKFTAETSGTCSFMQLIKH